jgi:predicted metalloprotease with PDZ domain
MLVMFTACVFWAPLFGEVEQELGSDLKLEELLIDLGSADFLTRESAQKIIQERTLDKGPDFLLTIIEAAKASHDPEIFWRLKKAAQATFKPRSQAYFGFLYAPLEEGVEFRGLQISEVKKNSPAEKAGLRVDDVILSLEDITLAEVGTEAKILEVFSRSKVGQKNRMTILRDGRKLRLKVTPAERDMTHAEKQNQTQDFEKWWAEKMKL